MVLTKSLVAQISNIIQDQNLSENDKLSMSTDIKGNLSALDVFNEHGWQRSLYKRLPKLDAERMWLDLREHLLVSINPAAKTFLQVMQDMQSNKKYELL